MRTISAVWWLVLKRTKSSIEDLFASTAFIKKNYIFEKNIHPCLMLLSEQWAVLTFGPLPEGLGACSWVIALVIQSIGLPWNWKCTLTFFLSIDLLIPSYHLRWYQWCCPSSRLWTLSALQIFLPIVWSPPEEKFCCLFFFSFDGNNRELCGCEQPTSLSMRLSLASG